MGSQSKRMKESTNHEFLRLFSSNSKKNILNLTGDRDGERVGGSDGLGVLPGVGLLVGLFEGLRVRISVGF